MVRCVVVDVVLDTIVSIVGSSSFVDASSVFVVVVVVVVVVVWNFESNESDVIAVVAATTTCCGGGCGWRSLVLVTSRIILLFSTSVPSFKIGTITSCRNNGDSVSSVVSSI